MVRNQQTGRCRAISARTGEGVNDSLFAAVLSCPDSDGMLARDLKRLYEVIGSP